MAPPMPLNNAGTAPIAGFTGTVARPSGQVGTDIPWSVTILPTERQITPTFQSQVPQFPVNITQIFSQPGSYSVLMDFNPCPQHRNNNANNNFISRGSRGGRVGRDVTRQRYVPSSSDSDNESSVYDIFTRTSPSSNGPRVTFDTSTSSIIGLPTGPTLNRNTRPSDASGLPPIGQLPSTRRSM